MSKITVPVKKLNFKELEALQEELEIYNKYVAVHELKNNFLDTIITFDTVNNLYYILRTRLENPKSEHTIQFSVTQAAIIIKCCNFPRTDRDDFTKHVMTKLKIDIDKKLIDLV